MSTPVLPGTLQPLTLRTASELAPTNMRRKRPSISTAEEPPVADGASMNVPHRLDHLQGFQSQFAFVLS